MEKSKSGFHVIGVIVVCAISIACIFTAFSLYIAKKKKEEKELEDYLECEIR